MLRKFLMLYIAMASSFFFFSCKGKSDADIKSAVVEKLSANPALANVTADVNDGVVTTGGEVSDEASKSLAETTVKSVDGVKSVMNNTNVATPPVTTAPVEVSTDDALNTGVNDAIKDYEGVKADVKDGVVTLTGNIKRDKLQKLMMSLNTLKPKKINNHLTIK